MHPKEHLWNSLHFPWETMRRLRLEPIRVYRGEVIAGAGPMEATHPFYVFWWLLEGGATLKGEKEVSYLAPGQWVLIPAGVWRRQHFRPGSRIISVNFQCSWDSDIPIVTLPGFIVGTKETLPPLYPLADTLCTELQAEGQEGQTLLEYRPSLAGGLLFRANLLRFAELLLGYSAAQGGGRVHQPEVLERRLRKPLEWLREHPRAGPLPFKTWQKETGLGRSQLDRLAREHLGMGINAYRDHRLLSEICRVLDREPLLIKQVAERFGFVDSAHFCRWMRRKTGHSPEQWRRLSE